MGAEGEGGEPGGAALEEVLVGYRAGVKPHHAVADAPLGACSVAAHLLCAHDAARAVRCLEVGLAVAGGGYPVDAGLVGGEVGDEGGCSAVNRGG